MNNKEYNTNLKLWLMLIKEKDKFRYTKSEKPCLKGELVIPLINHNITIGWQR